jgi:hypothetical protein
LFTIQLAQHGKKLLMLFKQKQKILAFINNEWVCR